MKTPTSQQVERSIAVQAPPQPSNPEVLAPRDDGALFRVTNREELKRGLSAIVEAGLCSSIGEAWAKAWAGHHMGLDPMEAVQGLNFIPGKGDTKRISASAQLLHTLVLRHSDCEWFVVESATDTKAVVSTRRKSWPPDVDRRLEWTIEQAKAAGLTGKDNWRAYPRAMLKARAISELAREAFPEILGGVYDPEELER